MAQILIEESAIDTLRDMVQKLQDERDELLKLSIELLEAARVAVDDMSGEYYLTRRLVDNADAVITKHTTEPKVMA